MCMKHSNSRFVYIFLILLFSTNTYASWDAKVIVAEFSPNTDASTIRGLENFAPLSTVSIDKDNNMGLSFLYNINNSFQLEMYLFPPWDIGIKPKGLEDFGSE